MKTITVREFCALKRNARNVSSYLVKMDKINNKIEELKAELESIKPIIEAFDAGSVAMCGKHSYDLLDRVVVEGKTAADYVPKAGKLEPVYQEKIDEDGVAKQVIAGYAIIEEETMSPDTPEPVSMGVNEEY